MSFLSRLTGRALYLGRVTLIVTSLLVNPALAGQNCELRRPSIDSLKRELALAASVAEQLEEMAKRDGTQMLLIARAGQDLSEYGLRYSHLGIAYRDHAALNGRGAWRVVHKLNQCGTDGSVLHRHGLGEFFSDGLHLHEAGAVVLNSRVAARLAPLIKNDSLLGALHEPRYNMVAYPWSGPYQQSNQWAMETLVALLEPAVDSRTAARQWLRAHGFRPTVLQVSSLTRLGARVSSKHISFDDHPLGRRIAGQIETVTVDSAFEWMTKTGLGGQPMRLRIRSGDRPLAGHANAV